MSFYSTAGTVAVAGAAVALCGWYTAAVIVLGWAAVVAALGAALHVSARTAPATWQCTRRIDQGHGAPWGRCTLQHGHQGTCVP